MLDCKGHYEYKKLYKKNYLSLKIQNKINILKLCKL